MDNNTAQNHIVIAGAGYAGLHIALRLAARLERKGEQDVAVTLVDTHDYHQVLTELPQVAAGTRADAAVRVPLDSVLARRVTFVRTTVSGVDLDGRMLRTADGPLPYTRLVLALGSQPADDTIPGLREHALCLWSVDDAARVWAAVRAAVQMAAECGDEEERRRLLTVVIGGAGATGVELAGTLAEELPALARGCGLPADLPRVILIEAGPIVLADASPRLIEKASEILATLGVRVHTNAAIAAVTPEGVRLAAGEAIIGRVVVWAGGVRAPALVAASGLPTLEHGRVAVDGYLRARDHAEVYVAGDLAAVIDPATGCALPPLAQVALEEGETVAHNLLAELRGRPLETFAFRDKGFVVSVGDRRGVATVAGHSHGGRLAHVLKDAIEWEYRQSVTHLHGWSPI